MSRPLKQGVLLLAVAGSVIGLDQLAKWLTVHNLSLGQTWDPIPAISPFIRVMHSQNMGAAFGMFPTAAPVLLVIALAATLIFTVVYFQLPPGDWLMHVSVAMIVGGAASNAIDRIRQGFVVDYFHIKLWANYSNISNFADHAIFFGTILLLIAQWRMDRAAQRAEAAEADDPEPVPNEHPITSD